LSTYRVYEVAEELGVGSAQLIQILREMDVPVRSHMSVVDEGQIARLHARLERERRTGSSAPARSSGSARRRRRRVQPEPQEIQASEVSEELATLEESPFEEMVAERVGEDVGILTAEALTTEADAQPPELEEVEQLVAADEVPEAIETAEEADVPEEATAAVEAPEVVVQEEAARAIEEAAAAEEASAEPEEAVELATTASGRPRRKPKPVRRGMPAASAVPAAPAASAAPGGSVRIQAEGYTVDGRRKPRAEKRRQRNVDQGAVKENVRRTLAALEGSGGGRKRRREAPSAQQEAELERQALEAEAEKKRVRVNEFLTVAELGDLISVSAGQVITSAFKNLGLMVTINQRLDFDQIELICEEFGYEAAREEAYEAEISELTEEEEEEAGDLSPRAPVVTVMGHVDHGKTSLLDHIRQTNVIAGEAGGITQHIGAYRVDLGDEHTVTFLDTPGHEAFTAMRARGAELTDVVVLVVAADDAVMPQTVEAISHAKNAGVPIIVAINKIDLPAADVSKVQQDLLTHGVVLEEFGGDVLSEPVSAKTGQGVDELLEKILLQAELLELKANPERRGRGTVVEAQLDRGMGPVATVLVQSGTFRVGDDFICGLFGGRVRAMLDERGQNVESAGPSMPVRILGLEGVPQAGDSIVGVDAERAREIAGRRQQLEREKDIRRRQSGARLEELFDTVQAGQVTRLNLVIKADTDGSVQALSDALERLSTDEVRVEVIHRGVGAVNESDVLLASTSSAAIIGFHVRPDVKARDVAQRESIEIRYYDVIYEVVEDIRMALEGLLRPEEVERILGTAEVRQLFRIPKVGTVAGCYVSDGVMQRNLPVHLVRDQVRIFSGKIASLKRFKDDAREVREGYECGVSIEGYNDIKEGDLIECYRIDEVARTLAESAAASESAS
jgi:translation initiation factor IF-2